jgi:hypothetical protein
LPLFAGTTLAGTALLSGGQQAQDQDRMNRFAEIYGTPPQSAGAGRGFINEQPEARFAEDAVGSGRGAPPASMDAYLKDRASAEASNAALDVARSRAAPPMPTRRPEEFRAPSGGLASLFSGPAYQSKGGELRKDGKINWGDSDSAADFFRADRARMETPDAPGMATGGAANGKPDKNEAIHRALDIISHLVGHRR